MLRATLGLVTALLVIFTSTAEAQSIQGIWRLTGAEIRGGPDAGAIENQGGLLVYGEDHFVWVLDLNEDPRPTPAEDASDSQIVEVLQGFTAVAGTYELDGKTIRYSWDTAVNPANVAQNQPQERDLLELTGDRLVTGVTDEEGVTTTLVYERVE